VRVLAIDPGATTGWVIYDSEKRCVIERGSFVGHYIVATPMWELCDATVVERPVAHGPTRPQVVDCAYVAGRLTERLADLDAAVHELTRLDVKKVLTDATFGEVRVKNDATAWAALKLLHGKRCDKKGGPLHGVRSHERAATALAVAYLLRIEKISFVHLDEKIASL
jgi:hypothetical protein